MSLVKRLMSWMRMCLELLLLWYSTVSDIHLKTFYSQSVISDGSLLLVNKDPRLQSWADTARVAFHAGQVSKVWGVCWMTLVGSRTDILTFTASWILKFEYYWNKVGAPPEWSRVASNWCMSMFDSLKSRFLSSLRPISVEDSSGCWYVVSAHRPGLEIKWQSEEEEAGRRSTAVWRSGHNFGSNRELRQ